MIIRVALLVVLCFNFTAAGAVIFDDGQLHEVSYVINDDVRVKDNIHEATSLKLITWGVINGSLEVHDTSKITISGGQVTQYLRAYGSSQITLSEGKIGMQFFAEGWSSVIMSGGLIDDVMTIQGNSKVTISGGKISQWVTTDNTSNLTVSGGLFAGSSHDFYVGYQSVVTFIGSDFAINGNSVAYGQYYASDFAGGTLTGTLANGDMLNSGFNIYDNASIVLTPEPATLLLLGLGAVILRKRTGFPPAKE
jgi:hypothetical protein